MNPDAVNHRLRREMWEGQLPAVIKLSKQDLAVPQEPMVQYCMLFRLNYFTSILEKVKACFDDFVEEKHQEDFSTMWFEFNGQPLAWDVPIGVQFDTIIGLDKKA